MNRSVGGDSVRQATRCAGNATRRRGRPLASLALATILVLLPAPAAPQDTVYLAGSTGGQTRITGQILDYTGGELRLKHPGGQEQSLPAARVLRIETQYGPQQTEADAQLAKRQFERALPLYLKALESEPRRWVRRQIIAQVVCCYDALGRRQQAGEAFLLLIRDDPETPYFPCIPLAWMPGQPPADLETAARQWLARSEPAARLLGASHLLSGRDRAAARQELARLAAGKDRRVAALARAQGWRAELVTATVAEVDGWSRLVEQMPEPLAAGPYFLLGRARARRQQHRQAALALLRVAILYPQQRDLAAHSLAAAGRALEELDQPGEALRLYRELIRDYPEQTRAVAEAQGRLEHLQDGIKDLPNLN